VVDELLDWLARLPTLPTYLTLAVLSALENVFPPVPADTAVALGAFLSQRGEVDAVILGVVCWLANLGSAAWMYFFARRHGASFFAAGWPRHLLPPEAMAAIQEAYGKYGVAGIFVSRFLPGVRAAVMPFAGIVHMPPLRALVPAGLASGLWYAFLVFAGTTLGRNWDAVKGVVGDANRVLGLLGAAFTLGVFYWVWRRARRFKQSSSPREG
jgi:membrane protein DedA with SNARE-associated domain